MSQDVKNFLAKHVDSIGKLEVLLFLHERCDQGCTAEELAHDLRMGVGPVKAHLEDLKNRKILKQDPSREYAFCFDANGTFSPVVAETSLLYRDYRTKVIEWIYSVPTDKLTEFANAFKIRKD